MLAYRLSKAQAAPGFQQVPDPHAGPGQVVVRVAGSGLCHTDFTVISREQSYWKDQPPPFTLGHEIAGWVEEVGTGVTKFHPGDAVAVNPSWGSCGRCHMCRSGEENHCLYQKAIRAPGVGYDGGHAPYVFVPEERFLVPIGDLDPVLAAPLTDAGITTYTAIKPALPHIWPGSAVVVIGVGGLGLYAVQFLRLLTGARVIAVDSTEARLNLAREYGADDVVSSGPEAAARIRDLTNGIGASFVLDCVGINPTLVTGVGALSWGGRLVMVGAGGGSVPFDFFKVPPGSQLATSFNGGSIALMEVVAMAAFGRLRVLVDRYPLRDAKKAYDDFEHGRLVGRAVLIPGASKDADREPITSRRAAVSAGASV
ncbi:MAG TPA: NAD(P)-dependent alcohol dehydrogenase [Thermoanaerobaculia bacterium]|nr:NAD(P)-dependent alcohol dehydrogenase [Thermoanaerobaculia bacterium]